MKHLTQDELYYIYNHCGKFNCGLSLYPIMKIPEIAQKVVKHKSTIYKAIAYMKAVNWHPLLGIKQVRGRNKVQFKIKLECLTYIKDKLTLGWSPEVISGRMRRELKQKISFKTIYRYIAHDKQSGGKLYKLLPHQGKKYKYGANRTSIKDRVDISKRPFIVEAKTRLGDLEGDTIVGSKHGSKECLLTLVDRASKFTMLRKIPNKSANSVEQAMYHCYDNSTIPFITITYDNGTEFANHKAISKQLGCSIFFARPYRSSDRGLNEHTNGLVRRFFPKKTDFAKISPAQVQHVQNLLNNRPRKALNFLTPNEFLNKKLLKSYKNMSRLT